MSSFNFDMVLLCFCRSIFCSFDSHISPAISFSHTFGEALHCVHNMYAQRLHSTCIRRMLMMAHAMIGRQLETPKHARTHMPSKSLSHENEIQWISKLKIGIFNLGGCFTLYSGCTLQSNAKSTFKGSITIFTHFPYSFYFSTLSFCHLNGISRSVEHSVRWQKDVFQHGPVTIFD